ncbi:Alpha/beta-Hydrolases superfamily protein [Tripterygium wilfordii]|uniref:Alpha/beta-Hydrolases superfamily protein n=1 Tax=Tripterygium wilfordii TaxID=458696 RepID=A0A7J7CFD6_TRIWF|nr:phospholipase A(1) DAD1, chloroplastic-like [Tripterygium wilfordii]KAF5732868.1 Alpha/beta-Hydrolases superfamily protein [Tripterygium wilfordii]
MKLAAGFARPSTVSITPNNLNGHSIITQKINQTSRTCCTLTATPRLGEKTLIDFNKQVKNWERFLDPVEHYPITPRTVKLGQRWKEYQGIRNWDGLLDPLDERLRGEILRYGEFVEAAYKSFDFDPSSPTYATCRFPKSSLLDRSGLPQTGYRITRNLRATSGIQLPRWVDKAPSWVATQSSWIGYVAVCQDKNEIARLGRRDVVIAFRGTATGLEWLENIRATLSPVHENAQSSSGQPGPMVESGFLSLYNSSTATSPSLRDLVRDEIKRLLQSYGNEPLSITITGHSLGAALATLAAHDIKTEFKRAPLVTVISFGGPRVGNRCFRRQLEKQGTKVLRIVNDDDLITKVPGFVIDDDMSKNRDVHVTGLPSWIRKRVEDTQWVYAEVGRELRLRSKDSPHLKSVNVATCHELKTYLHLVNGFVSSTCPFRDTVQGVLNIK